MKDMFEKNKTKHGLIRFSFAWKPFCNDLEVNRARGDREIRLWKMSGGAPSFWLVPGSIPWTPKNARERSQERQFSFSALALLTTPQKHLRIASYKLWSHSGSNQARTSRKPAKIIFVLVSTGFNSLNTQKRTRTLTGTPIFIFSLSPVNYTSETP